MTTLSNSPRDTTTIEAEARKSLSIGLRVMDSHRNPLDMTAASVSIVGGKVNRQGVHVQHFDQFADMTWAADGYARINLQAIQLNMDPGSYVYTITLQADGYSSVLLKGEFKVVQNTEYYSIDETYDTAALPQAFEVIMRHQGDIHIQLANMLPPDVLRLPLGGEMHQVLMKKSDDNHDMMWATLDGGLSATGVMQSLVPMANGDGTWNWGGVVLPAELAATNSMIAGVADSVNQALVDIWNTLAGLNISIVNATNTANEALARSTPVGVVEEYAGAVLPNNGRYLWARGGAYSTTGYPELFAAIGYTHGGSGTTFYVPNKNGRTGFGYDPTQSEFGILGKLYGTKTHTLTLAEIPNLTAAAGGSHSHTPGGSAPGTERFMTTDRASNPRHDTAPGAGASTWVPAVSTNDNIASAGGTSTAPAHTHVVNNTGGGAHNNVPPGIAMNYIIRSKA